MGSKTVQFSFDADASMDQVLKATKKSLMLLGGTTLEMGSGLQVKEGKNGVSSAFAANFDAIVNLQERSPGKYEVYANINWSPNAVFWICLVLGFFLVIPWVVNIMYLFIDPSSEYQSALFRIQGLIDK